MIHEASLAINIASVIVCLMALNKSFKKGGTPWMTIFEYLLLVWCIYGIIHILNVG